MATNKRIESALGTKLSVKSGTAIVPTDCSVELSTTEKVWLVLLNTIVDVRSGVSAINPGPAPILTKFVLRTSMLASTMSSCPEKLLDTKARKVSPLVAPWGVVLDDPPPHETNQQALTTIRKIPATARFNGELHSQVMMDQEVERRDYSKAPPCLPASQLALTRLVNASFGIHTVFWMRMASDFLARLQKGPVLCDGAMGTLLYSKGIFINKCYDELNVSQPDLIRGIHHDYLQAGAEIIETN